MIIESKLAEFLEDIEKKFIDNIQELKKPPSKCDLILDFSGLKLSKNGKEKIKKWNIKHVSKPIPKSKKSSIPVLVNHLINSIIEISKSNENAEKLLSGQYIFIPPKNPTATQILAVIFHAITGHFPRVVFMQKDRLGRYTPSDPFDLYEMRNRLRSLRDERIMKYVNEYWEKDAGEGDLILNLSGHILLEEAINILKNRGSQLFKHSFYVPYENHLKNLLKHSDMFFEKLMQDEKRAKKIKEGDFLMIPPGYSPLSQILLTKFYDISGKFPREVFLVRTSEENEEKKSIFIPIETLDLNELLSKKKSVLSKNKT